MRINRITVKVIVSYVLLISVSVVAGYIIIKEIKKLSQQEKINQEDRVKIIQIGKILSLVNETENAGRVTIRTDDDDMLQLFLQRNIELQNELLKFRRDISSEKQLLTLDTISNLLNLRKENIEKLKAFQESDSSLVSIHAAIRKLSSLEPYFDYDLYNKYYTRHKKNLIPPQSADIISIVKRYKNVKIPPLLEQRANDIRAKKNAKFDKVLNEILEMLNKINKETEGNRVQIDEQLHKMWDNDVQLSKNLDDLLHNFEEEVIANSQRLNQERQVIFENSKNLLILAFFIAMGIIAISLIVIINDFITSQRYRRRLEMANRKTNNLKIESN